MTQTTADKLAEIVDIILNDESGDQDFIKFRVKEAMAEHEASKQQDHIGEVNKMVSKHLSILKDWANRGTETMQRGKTIPDIDSLYNSILKALQQPAPDIVSAQEVAAFINDIDPQSLSYTIVRGLLDKHPNGVKIIDKSQELPKPVRAI